MNIRGWLSRLGFHRLILFSFRLWPRREFLVYNEQRLTRRQVLERLMSLATALQGMGIQKGERVVSLLPACPEAVYAQFLPHILGSVNVPLNPLLGEHELRHILRDCGARAIIATKKWSGRDFPALLSRLLPDLPDLRLVLVKGGEENHDPFFSLEKACASPGNFHPPRLAGNDVVLIAYTSGTTGLPKGVVHTRAQIWGMAAGKVGKRLDVSPLRCLLLPFPPFHIAGLLGIGVALLAGGKVILMERFSPPGMLELIEKEKVTQIGGSPTMYLMLLRTPGQERYDLTSVKRITFSTETCPPDLARRLYERFGCTLENMYSTTESLLISWTGAEDGWEKAATTVGRPVPGAQVRIVDDRRQPLPVGQQGEIAVKTATIMTGYYGDPALTAQVLDDEGWYYTGDIGFLGKDGYLRLAGRKKDLILRGGEKFSPIEVESYLETHPAIRRTAVIGVPNKLGTQSVWAYVELQPGARLSAGEINGYCQGQLAPFKIPEQVRFIEQLPLTLLGKVQKFKLHQLAAQEQPAE